MSTIQISELWDHDDKKPESHVAEVTQNYKIRKVWVPGSTKCKKEKFLNV